MAEQELLDFAISIARSAGEIALRYFQRLPQTQTKSDGTIVTAADREIEQYLRAALEQRFPDDAILGEEFGERRSGRSLDRPGSGRRWILDPIDGTVSFAHGVATYAVLIGLEIDGDAAAGVAHFPSLRETVWAARGLGCFWNGEPARVSQVASIDDALLLATDFSECAAGVAGASTGLLLRQAHWRRGWGDAFGHILVATGRAEIMFDPEVKIWDCAALLPILEEAGGTFTDWSGKRTISGGSAISTNGRLFDDVFSILSGRGA